MPPNQANKPYVIPNLDELIKEQSILDDLIEDGKFQVGPPQGNPLVSLPIELIPALLNPAPLIEGLKFGGGKIIDFLTKTLGMPREGGPLQRMVNPTKTATSTGWKSLPNPTEFILMEQIANAMTPKEGDITTLGFKVPEMETTITESLSQEDLEFNNYFDSLDVEINKLLNESEIYEEIE